MLADDIIFVPRFVPFGHLSVRSNFERENTNVHSEWKFPKPRRMRWAGRVANLGRQELCIQGFGGGKTERNRLL